MIEEPPLLRILPKDRRPRPSAAQITAIKGAETGHICDALGGTAAMDADIQSLGALPPAFLGPALTVDCGPADILALLAAIAEAQPGDVLVLSTGGFRGCASVGDQVAGMARNAGIAGIVTDGMARDIDGIEAVGLPLFAAGLSPNSPYGKGPGAVGHSIVCGGRPVATGDLVLGDRTGVAVLPFGQIDAVAETLVAVRAAEAGLAEKVAGGLVAPDEVHALLASDKVSWG